MSPIPGTTRDPIEVQLDLGGYAVVLVDTAGLRPSDDVLEQAGIARARARAASADLVLWLQDAATLPAPPGDRDPAAWLIGTKADAAAQLQPGYGMVLSAHTGEGVRHLVERLTAEVGQRLVGGETILVGRARHRAALDRAARALRRAVAQQDAELMAEELRAAAAGLTGVVGVIGVEDVLGTIFARFCIGK